MIEKHKISRYLFYAFGEIILVVIGILIALQINNWNEDRKVNNEENKILISLKKEIESNLESIENTIKSNETILNLSSTHLDSVITNRNFEFNIAQIPSLFGYNTNRFDTSILNEILGTNSRALITDEKYLNQLRILKQSYERSDKTQFYVDEFWNGEIMAYLIDSGIGIYINNHSDLADHKIGFKIDNTYLSLLSIMNEFQQTLLMSREDLKEDLNTTLEVLNGAE